MEDIGISSDYRSGASEERKCQKCYLCKRVMHEIWIHDCHGCGKPTCRYCIDPDLDWTCRKCV